MRRLVVPAELWENLVSHFRDASPSEDGAFALIRRGQSTGGTRYLLHELLLPGDASAWDGRGNHNLTPSARWLSSAIGAAIDTGSGLCFVHSHPGEHHPPHLSPVDARTSLEWARTICPVTDDAFVSLVWTSSGLAGWVFDPDASDAPSEFDVIEVVGDRRRSVIHPAVPGTNHAASEELDDRQRRALGAEGNLSVRGLRVGLIGAGGTGSPLGEQLVRMGVAELVIVDSDVLDTASNLRRVVGATSADLDRGINKADLAKRHLDRLGLGTRVQAIAADVRNEVVGRRLLDMDVIMCTTDTHSSRAVVNQLAYQYWVPVIDVGVAVGTDRTGCVSGMPAEVRILLPDTGCLWCRDVLSASRIRAENLPASERETLIQEGYVQGLDVAVPSVAALNWFAAALAALALLRVVTAVSRSVSFVLDGWELYVQELDASAKAGCLCHSWRGSGDQVPVPWLEQAAS